VSRRHPLHWPEGWPRVDPQYRDRARFGSITRKYVEGGSGMGWNERGSLTIHAALRRLSDELARLGASDSEISSNVPLRLDGLPYSDVKEPRDPGVAVYFRRKGQSIAMACDKWDRAADNIAAIAAHIDALRRIERYGVGSLDRAFTGYAALPAPGRRAWRDVIRVGGMVPTNKAELRAWFNLLARERHPDHGGSDILMAELNAAMDAARKELVT
jgi:hypothetical protein